MKFIKAIELSAIVEDDQGQVVATLISKLRGDGATPDVTMLGSGSHQIIGYKDDGSVILSNDYEERLKNAQRKFMAEAIKVQKALCVENGVDPELVNIINAEKKVNNESAD